MDINARINWQPGMELTAQTFLDLDAGLDFRQQTAIRAALGEHCLGLLPGMPFEVKGFFHANTYEINRLQLTAILPSGSIIQVDEPVSVAIPLLYGAEYYLTVGFGDGLTPYEKDGVPYVRPQYSYAIQTQEEAMANDVFPIVKFTVKDGIFAVNDSFIPPCLLLSCVESFNLFRQQYTELLRTIAEHEHLKEGDGKRLMMRYFFMMKSYDMQGRVADFVRLTHEIAQAVDYFIMTPYADKVVEIPMPRQVDVAQWLQWLVMYLTAAATVLDGVALEDNTIDYDALLAQAKKELYEQLHPELYEKLLAQIKEELKDRLEKSLTETLTSYINEVVKPELGHILGEEIHDRLYEELYSELYERLYNALYISKEEEDEFVPMI